MIYPAVSGRVNIVTAHAANRKVMKKMKSIPLKLFLLFAFLICLSLPLVSCTAADYVADELDEYNVPAFNEKKFKAIERIYRDYFVTDLPEKEELARLTAQVYFDSYANEIDTGNRQDVTTALINAYIDVIGDRYSVYRSPEEYIEYDNNMSGAGHGIGVLVSRLEGVGMLVEEVYRDSGADRAGILAGDVIVAVGGESVAELGYEAAVEKVKGEADTEVEITLLREESLITLSVLRGPFEIKSVTYSLDENKIGYVKISSFKDNTYDQFKEAISCFEENGAVGIIYDLRGNLGGYLSSVVKILSHIAPSGTEIVSFSNNYANPKKDNDSHSMTLPSVVLCDERTASAAELFTAAIRDFCDFGYFEALTVGERTFGKGIMQSTFKMSDGSTITLTVAYYNSPSGENYHGVGILPDIVVGDEEGDVDVQLARAYTEINNLVN